MKHSFNMKVLSISMDRGLFTPDSAVHARTVKYGELVDELHIIVFSHKQHELVETRIGENVHVYPTQSSHKLLYIVNAFFIGLRVLKKIKDEETLVTTQDASETGIVGLLLSKTKSVPLHIQIHVDIFSQAFAKESTLNRVRVMLARLTLRHTARIRVVSDRIKQSLIEHFGEEIESCIDVLPIFVELATQEKPVRRTYTHSGKQIDRRILIVARLESEKNVGLALHVLADTLPDNPTARLVIAGDGSEREALEERARQLHISNSVDFLGWTTDLTEEYMHADVYLQTSNYEGYGLALVEAAATGCPIVTTDVGLVGDLLVDDESVLACPSGDKTCLSEKVRTLIKDRNLAKKLGIRARAHIREKYVEDMKGYLTKYKKSFERAL